MQGEIESLKSEGNTMKIKIAELNVVVKNDQVEIKRLQKEYEKLLEAYNTLQ